MSCEICRRKVKPRGEHLWCDRCNKLAGFPIPRYLKSLTCLCK
ncbi:hypothetical protein RGQ29_003572 [Quercus rubra]|uniref:Uncharacterized protein n=1 Tax=Quercus rubra TaxID=3512 RepID=A0AAN7ECA7_QUERU|nr:hypothetical protein RGQ29_003572 [Quercus rubra]